jgi:tetratricopeptide (TPR) repeat protein
MVRSNKPTLSIQQSMALAWQHYAQGSFQDAGMISVRVLEVEPKNPDALHLLGILAYRANDQDNAIQFISAAIREHGTYAPMHGNLALAKLARGDLNGAAISARRSFELQPSYADAHRVLGLVYCQKGRLKEAIQEFKRAQGLGLNTADLLSHLSHAQARLKSDLGHDGAAATSVG